MSLPSTFLFCGVEMSRDAYDEFAAISAYVFKHLHHRLTALERRASWPAIPLVSNSHDPKARHLAEFYERRDGHVPDAEVLAVYDGDRQLFRKQAVTRVLADYSDEIARCRQCSRVPHAPRAIKCPWCACPRPADDVDDT